MMKKVLILAVFSCLTVSGSKTSLAEMGEFQAPQQLLMSQGQPPPNNRRAQRGMPGLDINVDANAIIENWRAHQNLSRIGTPPRSGVRINGKRVGTRARADEFLFACPPGAFLEIDFGHIDQTGAVLYGQGRRGGCEAGQALVLSNDRLSCRWYTPRANRRALLSRQALASAEILLSAETKTIVLGECITASAEVVPAYLFPEGRQDANLGWPARGDCGGSGVSINGRVTGHRANCR